MLVGLGWFDQVKGEAQSTGNFFYLLVFLYSQHLANGLSWNGYSIFEWGRMKEVGQIDERGPTILALICIIFSYPVITPPPPRIGVKITWKYDLGIISVVKCPEQCSVLRLIEQGPGLKEFPILTVESSKREVDVGLRASLLHFSFGKGPQKEVIRLKSKRNEWE